MTATHTAFSGSIPENYDRYLGPLIFEDYAQDLAARAAACPGRRVLETAAGTGIATRHLRRALPADAAIVATDLNEPMLEHARTKLAGHGNIELRAADATALPFPDRSFDTVACQFGVMFFPDKHQALREVARVLKPGGAFVFNVWDSFEHNHLVRTVDETIGGFFPHDPPAFFQVPYGYHRIDAIQALLQDTGFCDVEIEVQSRESASPQARHVALGYIDGTPMSAHLAAHSELFVEEVRGAVEQAVGADHGSAPTRARMQAIIVTARVRG